MSIVRLRPELPEALEAYQQAVPDLFPEWYDEAYLGGKPGLTSKSTLYKHGVVAWHAAHIRHVMELDLREQQEASLVRDIEVLAQTPLIIVKRAFELKAPVVGAQAAYAESE